MPQPDAPSEQRPPVIEEVRRLVQLMVDNDLAKVDVTDGQRKILLKRGGAYVPAVRTVPAGQAAAASAAGQPGGAAAAAG